MSNNKISVSSGQYSPPFSTPFAAAPAETSSSQSDLNLHSAEWSETPSGFSKKLDKPNHEKNRKTRKKRGGRIEKHKELGIKINEILRRITDLERYNEYNDYGPDITENSNDIGIIKSYINYKLNNTSTGKESPLEQWQDHLVSIYNRMSEFDSEDENGIDAEILRDANVAVGGKRKKRMKRKTKRKKKKKRKKKTRRKKKKNKKKTEKYKYK